MHTRTPLRLSALAVVALATQGLAFGADLHTRILSSTCFNCHGSEGKSNQAIPALAGQDKAYLVQAMKEQKNGVRETTVMKKYMLGYTEAEIEKMAEYFAAIK